jgi:hypothetical protein
LRGVHDCLFPQSRCVPLSCRETTRTYIHIHTYLLYLTAFGPEVARSVHLPNVDGQGLGCGWRTRSVESGAESQIYRVVSYSSDSFDEMCVIACSPFNAALPCPICQYPLSKPCPSYLPIICICQRSAAILPME